MKKGYLLFMSGYILGMLIQQYVLKSNVGIGFYIVTSVVVIMFSFDQVFQVFRFIFWITLLLTIPITWMNNHFNWTDLIWVSLILTGLYYDLFVNIKTPLFVDEGDITRFTPQTISDTTEDEQYSYLNCF